MIARKLPVNCPEIARELPVKKKSSSFLFEGVKYSLQLEHEGWRLRKRSRERTVDHPTKTRNLAKAIKSCREFLAKDNKEPVVSRKGGGNLEALAAVYLAEPKRTNRKAATGNVSRLRTVCRLALGRELSDVTCREVGPELWQAYQRAALALDGLPFDLVTRRTQNLPINAAVRCARCLFLKKFIPAYQLAGLDVRSNAGEASVLPSPYMPPKEMDDVGLVAAWRKLAESDVPLWLVIGLARFAGLRRAEIAACRGSWIEQRGAAVFISLRDRPEDEWWTKTGKPYRAQVIDPALADYLIACSKTPSLHVVADPPRGLDRGQWFAHAPQSWLRSLGVPGIKPLHRLRGAYADEVAIVAADAVSARLAGVRAAQANLGHTNSATTEGHYLTPE